MERQGEAICARICALFWNLQGFRVQGSGFRVQGSGVRVEGLRVRVEDWELPPHVIFLKQCSGTYVVEFEGQWLGFGLVLKASGSRVDHQEPNTRTSKPQTITPNPVYSEPTT